MTACQKCGAQLGDEVKVCNRCDTPHDPEVEITEIGDYVAVGHGPDYNAIWKLPGGDPLRARFAR